MYTPDVRLIESCDNCTCPYDGRNEDEGPYGSVFSNMEDYYIWKNGSLTL